LYARYKREVLKNATDDRLDPEKAITYGFKYFASLMKQQKGDISLALASYNAGPHRVKQYKGLPPYAETIQFRNRVLGYYRTYLRKLNTNPPVRQACTENEKAPDESTDQEITGAEQKVP
jgi:soluble lytic murein transglycosylase-like protein